MKRNKIIRYIISYSLLVILIIALFIVNINSGSSDYSFKDVFETLLERDKSSTAWNIIHEIRMPRVIAAALLGGALSVSGFLLQNFFANPIAGPYILGISSGAKLTVALIMIFFMSKGIYVNSFEMIISAFIGSMISMGFILVVSGKVKRMSILIICGVMIGYICSAITDFIVTFADDSNIVNLHNWSKGSFSGINWGDVKLITVIVFASIILTFLLSKPMNAYRLGESYAINLGINIKSFRAMLILLSSILSATVTAFAGPVSFVGVAVPHIIKKLFKTSKPIVIIPACFLGGSVFCMFCDLISRTLFAPTELNISSVTAVFGAPIVIFMMVRRGEKNSNER